MLHKIHYLENFPGNVYIFLININCTFNRKAIYMFWFQMAPRQLTTNDELAAVMLPWGLMNAGFNLDIFSMLETLMPLSLSTTFPVFGTMYVNLSERFPSFVALSAKVWDLMLYSSYTGIEEGWKLLLYSPWALKGNSEWALKGNVSTKA